MTRDEALSVLTDKTYPGTDELVERLVAESKNHPAWRAVRAAAVRALHDTQQPRVWMTKAEFADWITVQNIVVRRRKEPLKPLEAVSIASSRKGKILRGEAAVSKVEALACAHFALRLPMPVAPGDVAGFNDWTDATFGAVAHIETWLELNRAHIGDRMRGYDIVKGEQRPRAPDAGLIRAMDWTARMGTACPYGVQPKVAVFPGQA